MSAIKNKTWNAALYLRLSKEDGDKKESASISAQREILREYLKNNPDIKEYACYEDDGVSGTTFDRPGFQRMMKDIDNGTVNCVIVKNYSRLARNSGLSIEMITETLVNKSVRFISVQECYDSYKQNPLHSMTDCITIGIHSVINESQVASTSAYIRGTLNNRRKQGLFIGSSAPFGYAKDPEDHHHLVIDEEAAEIVRLIFSQFISGYSVRGIARHLSELGVPNPSLYKQLKGENYKSKSKNNDGLWQESSVRRILQNPVYTGTMVQGKNGNISYKNQKCRARPKEEWYVVPNMHEPIISDPDFENAQQRFGKGKDSTVSENRTLFAGLVVCGDCGRAMTKRDIKQDYGEYSYYNCSTYKMKKDACTKHTIRIDKLYAAVLETIQQQIEIAVDFDNIIKMINSGPKKNTESDLISKSIQKTEKQLEFRRKEKLELYDDFKQGILTKDEYLEQKERIGIEIENTEKSLAVLKESAERLQTGVDGSNKFIAVYKKYKNITELTRPMLLHLIKQIKVFENNTIEIVFNYADPFAEAVEYIRMNEQNLEAAS